MPAFFIKSLFFLSQLVYFLRRFFIDDFYAVFFGNFGNLQKRSFQKRARNFNVSLAPLFGKANFGIEPFGAIHNAFHAARVAFGNRFGRRQKALEFFIPEILAVVIAVVHRDVRKRGLRKPVSKRVGVLFFH